MSIQARRTFHVNHSRQSASGFTQLVDRSERGYERARRLAYDDSVDFVLIATYEEVLMPARNG
jgi:hypothetical protein